MWISHHIKNFLLVFIVFQFSTTLLFSEETNSTDTNLESDLSTEAMDQTFNQVENNEKPSSQDESNALSTGETSAKTTKNKIYTEEELLKSNSTSTYKDQSKIKVDQSLRSKESDLYLKEAQRFKVQDKLKTIRLSEVIEQGLRKNFKKNLRDRENELNRLEFQSSFNRFWLPNIKLEAVSSNQLISLLTRENPSDSAYNSKIPNVGIGLTFGTYTIFNWGKDYALYLNDKDNLSKQNLILKNAERELKLDLIYSFFALQNSKSSRDIYQEELRHASYTYRLNKEKIKAQKISSDEYLLSRNHFLKAQSQFHQAKMLAEAHDEEFALLIGDSAGTRYEFIEDLNYLRIKFSINDAEEIAQQSNPLLKELSLDQTIFQRKYESALKDNLPLPKISVGLGTFAKYFGENYNSTRYTVANDKAQHELIATLNASWDIFGEDGLFNQLKVSKAKVNKYIGEEKLKHGQNQLLTDLRSTYKNIYAYQNQMLINEARVPNAQKTFENILNRYLDGKSKFYDYKLSLDDYILAKIDFEKNKLLHLQEKIKLAKIMGIEDFPGENFEHLAKLNKDDVDLKDIKKQ